MTVQEQVSGAPTYYSLHKNQAREYYQRNREKILKYQNGYYFKNYGKNLEARKTYYEFNKDKWNTYYETEKKKNREKAKWYKKRITALLKIDPKLECKRCGCRDIRFLEINHMHGGGNQELKNSKVNCMTKKVMQGRSVVDLELLCKPCNAIHYMEMKWNVQIPYYVVWEGKAE